MRSILRHAVMLSITIYTIGLLPLVTAAQPTLSLEELRGAGDSAYEKLPDIVSPNYVSPFSKSVRYYFAYEQRMLRQEEHLDHKVRRKMSWLYDNMSAFRYGKGDNLSRQRSAEELLRKGLRQHDKIAGEEKIVNIPAFISASANLYAYLQLQNTDNRNSSVANAFQWLQEKRRKGDLVTSGGKGDRFSWVPNKPKPDLDSKPSESESSIVMKTPKLYPKKTYIISSEEDSSKEESTTDSKSELKELIGEKHKKLAYKYQRLKASYREMEEYSEELLEKYAQLKIRIDSLESRVGTLEGHVRRNKSANNESGDAVQYDVILTGVNENRIEVIKAVHSLTDLGLKKAKMKVDEAPTKIAVDVSRQAAEHTKSVLEKAGARVEIQSSDSNL